MCFSLKWRAVIKLNPYINYAPSYSKEFHVFSDNWDIRHDIYPRAAFKTVFAVRAAYMTVFAVHPEDISEDSYYKDQGY